MPGIIKWIIQNYRYPFIGQWVLKEPSKQKEIIEILVTHWTYLDKKFLPSDPD